MLDCLVEMKPPFNPTSAVADMAATLKSYGLSSTVGDKYAAGWVVDAFAKVGVTYEHAERDRTEAYLDALPLFTSGRARLLDNPRLVSQFAALERRSTPVGREGSTMVRAAGTTVATRRRWRFRGGRAATCTT